MKKFFVFVILILSVFSTLKANDENLKKMIGQMIMIGFNGTKTNDKWVNQLAIDAKKGRLGGVMILSRNIESKKQLKNLTDFLHKNKLLIAIDEEGGFISRFNKFDDFEHFKSHHFVAQNYDLKQAKTMYKQMAEQLKELKIDINFAPVVDIHDPKSPIIGDKDRAFSDDIDMISAYASEFIDAFDEVGVYSVLKHFPGHGSSSIDTHKNEAHINKFDFNELKPYFALIKRKKAKFIMASHIVAHDIDDEFPTSLSYKALSELLKNKMGFEGVVISDDLLMNALAKYSLEERIVMAVNAGVDIVLISDYFTKQSNSIKVANDAIFNAVKSGKISQNRIKDAYNRIQKVLK